MGTGERAGEHVGSHGGVEPGEEPAEQNRSGQARGGSREKSSKVRRSSFWWTCSVDQAGWAFRRPAGRPSSPRLEAPAGG